MEKAGSFKYTRDYLSRIETEAVQEIERIGSNPQLLGIIKYLSTDYS